MTRITCSRRAARSDLTPEEKALWFCDVHNDRAHVIDATLMPPGRSPVSSRASSRGG
jgi:hypothetical protein